MLPTCIKLQSRGSGLGGLCNSIFENAWYVFFFLDAQLIQLAGIECSCGM